MNSATDRRTGERRLGSKRLRGIYGRDYYHGVTSGYPGAGYASGHPDWGDWLHVIRKFRGTGPLLDLGCAYGYLVEASEGAGYEAIGIDVSRYALHQEPALAGRLVEGRVEELPLPAGWAAVICVFDVLEHFEDPRQCLAECERVLAPDGLLVGATPDPLRFTRKEESHLYERPPSYWVGALQQLGFETRFRFSGADYNFQFLAARADSIISEKLRRLPPGAFLEGADFIETEGPLQVAPRDGWLSGEPAAAALPPDPASFYLLNPTAAPLEMSIEIELSATPGFSTLQLRLDSVVLEELHLTTEETSHRLRLGPVPVAAGGHHLWLRLRPGGPKVEIARLRIRSGPLAAGELTTTLPFDLYQRYQLAAGIVDALNPATVLDVGGVLGDSEGHLAAPADFLGSERRVRSTDLRHCDHPSHEIADAGLQPFGDRGFDAVVSMDVLEHLPDSEREAFLAELRRVASRWVILAAPVGSPAVRDAEERLGASLLQGHAFLGEHSEMGLPDEAAVTASFEQAGWSVVSLPNGYLPHWVLAQALTQVVFAARDFETWSRFNRLYNRHFFPLDQQEPPYRRFWIAARQPFDDATRESLDGLAGPGTAGGGLEALAADSELIALLVRCSRLGEHRAVALSAAQFIANARDEGLQILRSELEETPLTKLALRRLRKRRGQ